MVKRNKKGQFVKGSTPWMQGKKHTDKTKEKIYRSMKEQSEEISLIRKRWFKEGKLSHKGNKHPNWKGGIKRSKGYVYIWKPNHPRAHKSDGYIKRANLVWEQNTGEIIKKPFILHHINGIKDDDSFENLQKMTQGEHINILNKKRK